MVHIIVFSSIAFFVFLIWFAIKPNDIDKQDRMNDLFDNFLNH